MRSNRYKLLLFCVFAYVFVFQTGRRVTFFFGDQTKSPLSTTVSWFHYVQRVERDRMRNICAHIDFCSNCIYYYIK